MVIGRINLRGLEMDLAGAAAVVALAAAGYLLLLRGPLTDVFAGNDLEERQAAAAISISTLQAQYRNCLGGLAGSRDKLHSRAGWMTSEDAPAEVLSRVNELARQCEVRITRWQPQHSTVLDEYQEQLFCVEGAASWPALLRWCALMEQGVPMLDMTHFAISAPSAAGQGGCEFSCWLKLYRGKEMQAPQVLTVAAQP